MPLQNRVDPWGQLNAIASKASTRMGNRGILHNDENQIIKPWAHNAWVACLPEFGGIKRPKPFSKGNYSELFFLDDVTAYAAGHRPCAYCQRAHFLAFKAAWINANMEDADQATISTKHINKVLHQERAARGGRKVSYEEMLSELPIGAMFEFQGAAFVVAPHGFLPWSFDGYGAAQSIALSNIVKVLTPRSIIRTFSGGFFSTKMLHPSAFT